MSVKQKLNKKRHVGFAAHPECINRKGRPKKIESLTDLLRVFLNEKLSVGPDKKIVIKQLLIEKITKMALEGDAASIKYIWDRLEGTPRQSIVFGYTKEELERMTEDELERIKRTGRL